MLLCIHADGFLLRVSKSCEGLPVYIIGDPLQQSFMLAGDSYSFSDVDFGIKLVIPLRVGLVVLSEVV